MITVENNKLIAEFMEWNKGENYSEKYPFYDAWNEPIVQLLPIEMPFNKNWDWLIPVVIKCYEVSSEENHVWEAIYYAVADLDMDKIYTAVVNFIKWYNNQQK